ncbi:MAG: type II toxin-antitoxin system RelE/ParE family toxin [Selenomonadaceae bacterium]|nr:type II toxin-antitoxin system RelE/ParE family toxin [Selenomonadaceae bacterium]
MWTKIARNIDLLALHNITLREPLVKPVENGIFELRTQVGNIKNSKTGSVKWIV